MLSPSGMLRRKKDKGLKTISNKNKERYMVAEIENAYLKEEIEKSTMKKERA